MGERFHNEAAAIASLPSHPPVAPQMPIESATGLPSPASLPRPFDGALTAGFAALGLFLPFSVAGVALALAAILLLAVPLAPAMWRTASWREPMMAAGLMLLAYIGLHTVLVSGWTVTSAQTVNRYQELLIAPLLFALFRLSGRRREVFFWSLVAGSVVFAGVHWAALFAPSSSAAAFVESRRISAGFTLAVCSFLLLEQVRGRADAWGWRVVAIFLAATVLFAVRGRTGQLTLLLLAACAGWMHSPPRWRWWAMLAAPVVLMSFAVASPAVHERLGETLTALTTPPQKGATSTAIRVELVRHGLQLAGDHYAIGAGFARYGEILQDKVEQHYAGQTDVNTELRDVVARTSNPHNEYVMQLVGGGLPALALFLAWLVLPMLGRGRTGRRCAGLVGVALVFAAACLFNSMLLDFIEGHFYVALMAWMLAGSDGESAA